MVKEGLRAAALSPYATHLSTEYPCFRWRTWREVGEHLEYMCESLTTRNGKACDILHEAKRDALVADAGEAHRQALKLARNSMIDALHELESDYSSDGEMSADDEDQP